MKQLQLSDLCHFFLLPRPPDHEDLSSRLAVLCWRLGLRSGGRWHCQVLGSGRGNHEQSRGRRCSPDRRSEDALSAVAATVDVLLFLHRCPHTCGTDTFLMLVTGCLKDGMDVKIVGLKNCGLVEGQVSPLTITTHNRGRLTLALWHAFALTG